MEENKLLEDDRVMVYGRPGPPGYTEWEAVVLNPNHVVQGESFVRVKSVINHMIYLVHKKQCHPID